jgi:hypothetical protein
VLENPRPNILGKEPFSNNCRIAAIDGFLMAGLLISPVSKLAEFPTPSLFGTFEGKMKLFVEFVERVN